MQSTISIDSSLTTFYVHVTTPNSVWAGESFNIYNCEILEAGETKPKRVKGTVLSALASSYGISYGDVVLAVLDESNILEVVEVLERSEYRNYVVFTIDDKHPGFLDERVKNIAAGPEIPWTKAVRFQGVIYGFGVHNDSVGDFISKLDHEYLGFSYTSEKVARGHFGWPSNTEEALDPSILNTTDYQDK